MSNPNYMHEFDPNRRGFCKTIVSGKICHGRIGDEVHRRFAAAVAKADESFSSAEVHVESRHRVRAHEWQSYSHMFMDSEDRDAALIACIEAETRAKVAAEQTQPTEEMPDMTAAEVLKRFREEDR